MNSQVSSTEKTTDPLVWPGTGIATTPGATSTGSSPRNRSVATGAADAVGLVDPHPGPVAVGPPVGVGHVVPMGEEDVGHPAERVERTLQRPGVPGGVDHEVPVRPEDEVAGGSEGVLAGVAQVGTGPSTGSG